MEEKRKRDDIEDEKTAIADRPRVWGVVGLGLLRGVVGTLFSINTLNTINEYRNNPYYEVYDWAEPAAYAALGLSVFSFICAILILRYMRWGLYFGAVAFGGDLVFGILFSLMSGQFTGALGLLLDILVLRNIYKYLNSYPETTFFT